jgi:iron-sulfur cluster repair protein YtfE (RIC family)
MTITPTPTPTPTLTVTELLRFQPAALPILPTAGIDPCCGGELTLAAAAQGSGLTFDQLAARLRRALETRDPAPVPPSCNCERRAG